MKFFLTIWDVLASNHVVNIISDSKIILHRSFAFVSIIKLCGYDVRVHLLPLYVLGKRNAKHTQTIGGRHVFNLLIHLICTFTGM